MGAVGGDGLRGDVGGRLQQLTGVVRVIALGVAVGVEHEPQRGHYTPVSERRIGRQHVQATSRAGPQQAVHDLADG